MPQTNTLVYDGVSEPRWILKNEFGKIIDNITLPDYTPLIKISFEEVNPIDYDFAAGNYDHTHLGYRVYITMSFPGVERTYIQKIRSVPTFHDYYPNGELWIKPHDDFDIYYKVKYVGGYSDSWIEDVAAGHSVQQMTFVGTDLLTQIPTGIFTFSHFCDPAITYDADDKGIHCYASQGCPFDFNIVRTSLPEFDTESGAYTIEEFNSAGNYYRTKALKLAHANASNVHYNSINVDDGELSCDVYGNDGTSDVLGLLFRATDKDNCYRLTVDTGNRTFTLQKIVATVATNLGSWSVATGKGVAPQTWFGIRVTFDGSAIRVYWRPKQVKDQAIPTPPYPWLMLGLVTNTVYTTGLTGVYLEAGHTVYFKEFNAMIEEYTDIAYDTTTDTDYISHYSPEFSTGTPI